jgi:cytochrome c biogenesis protein CcdA/thiol-disulfide isomerase/thioredoxin
MTLLILSYLGGVLTILSPCILPVIPFVFAQTGQPFRRSGLPMLIGMILTFALLSSLATVGGSWIVAANQYGRIAALVLMAIFGVTLLSERLSTILSQPFVNLGSRLAGPSMGDGTTQPSIRRAVLMGVATGLLWTPCAGPILGLILTGAAFQQGPAHSALLLTSYAAGAATALAIALGAGNRLSRSFKHILGTEHWLRRALGVAVLAGVASIAFGLDRNVLTQISVVDTNSIEQQLLDRFAAKPAQANVGEQTGQAAKDTAMAMQGTNAMAPKAANSAAMSGGAMTGGAMTGSAAMTGNAMAGNAMTGSAKASNAMAGNAMTGGAMTGNTTTGANMSGTAMSATTAANAAETTQSPLLDFTGAVDWLNSPPLDAKALRNKVVLVDFWTYSCVNCLRSLPYIRAWAERYKDQGLVVIGVHSPEFPFERDKGNVIQATKDLGITYPVAIDNNYAIWQSFSNEYWPAHYLFDATGKLRYQHFGEGKYAQTESVIQGLLAARNGQQVSSANATQATATVATDGAAEAADEDNLKSEETYIGYARSSNFVATAAGTTGAAGGGVLQDQVGSYSLPDQLTLNQWGLTGSWQVGAAQAQSTAPGAGITYRFHARDLNLVLGTGTDGKPVQFRVRIDGKAPGADHGSDTNADGIGTVTGHRLYQLVRQSDTGSEIKADHVFEIEFLDPGIQAYSFTFG